MRNFTVTTVVLLTLALTGCDQAQQQSATPSPAPSSAPMPMPSTTATTGVYTTTGQVTAVAPDSVTISHQPVPALSWPAMNMTFRAPDSAMIAGLQNGAQVEFSFKQEGSENILTDIKRR